MASRLSSVKCYNVIKNNLQVVQVLNIVNNIIVKEFGLLVFFVFKNVAQIFYLNNYVID